MIVSTTFEVHGRSVAQHLGLVRGNVVRSRFIGRDIVAGLRMIVGGEIHEYTKLLAESREQALDRMLQHAQSLGADAVIGVRFETTDAGQGQATEVLAYGTAVKLDPQARCKRCCVTPAYCARRPALSIVIARSARGVDCARGLR